ncbi:transposase [Escherichia coli]|nr:transposase [Escherichia coli]
MTASSDYESVQVFIGVDVGKAPHHAVARSEGVLVGYLPGLAMRRIADLHSDEAKTDARDAAIIAEAAHTLPHALHSLKLADEQIVELSMLCGFDDDLAAQTMQASNRIRGLLTQIHPALERVLGPRLNHPAVLDLLQRYPSPEKLALLGEKKLATQLCKLAPRLGKRLAADITQTLTPQTVIVPSTNAAVVVLPRLALQLITLRKQRDEVALEIEQQVLAHPLYPVLTSMPGVGVRTAARLLTEVACRAFAALRDPISRAYYTRKMSQGQRHNQALIALARWRCDVLFAIMRDGTFYTPATS